MKVTRTETRRRFEQRAHRRCEGGIVERADGLETKTRGEVHRWRGLGGLRGERILRGRALCGIGQRDAGDGLEFLDVRDEARVDELLGEAHQVDAGAEFTRDLEALLPGEQTLVDAKAG